MRIDPRRSAPLCWIASLLAFAALPLACGPFSVRSRALALLERRSPEVLYSVSTDDRALALTIDDGPDPDSTPRILEVLARHGASATFFLVSDRIPGNEALVEQIVASGHELGNHLTRDEASIDLPRDEFERELLRAHEILSEFAAPRWFRPGSGWYDEEMLETLARRDYRLALGSTYPFDAQIPSAWFATRVILGGAEPGAIIVLHDVGPRGLRTARTLEKVLPELQRRGYRVTRLSELVTLSEPPDLARASRGPESAATP
jgi:peptidoglycan/xylan/chitin deacetylase (PgdA/CDA1 family)